jgi:hypothetical protein
LPHYHFQIRTETHVLVAERVEMANVEDARLEASRRVGELLKVHAGQIWEDQDWQMQVADDAGLILFAIYISAIRSPAVSGGIDPLAR